MGGPDPEPVIRLPVLLPSTSRSFTWVDLMLVEAGLNLKAAEIGDVAACLLALVILPLGMRSSRWSAGHAVEARSARRMKIFRLASAEIIFQHPDSCSDAHSRVRRLRNLSGRWGRRITLRPVFLEALHLETIADRVDSVPRKLAFGPGTALPISQEMESGADHVKFRRVQFRAHVDPIGPVPILPLSLRRPDDLMNWGRLGLSRARRGEN